MRCLAWAVVCALVAAIPAVGRAEKPLPPPPPPIGGPGPGPGFPPAPAVANYKAPKADGAVVELLDEAIDPLFPVLINDGGGENGSISREDRDVFAGVEAARVTPQQKYRSRIPGWDYKIVEKPVKPGEFRYLRFAWKKIGGSGVMIQLHDPAKSWAFRYHAGTNVYGWQPSTQVSATVPTKWEVVTRDMFKDWGACTISGIALSALDGTAALFDHMLLGRTIEDLDKATDEALGRGKALAIPPREREALWEDLMGDDRARAATAQRAFLTSAANQVEFVGERLGKLAVDKELRNRIQKMLNDLDADDFDLRDKATDDLVKLGASAHEAVRALASGAPNDEVKYRAGLVLRRMNVTGAPVSTAGRTVRAVRVLERAGTAEAKVLLGKIADGEYGFDVAPDAKAALDRLKK